MLHLAKYAIQRGLEFAPSREVSVMSAGLARVLPQPLRRIELRRVGRQLMNLQPVPVGSEPTPNVCILVVGSVVLDQNGPLPPVGARQLLQEGQVGAGVEYAVFSKMETSAPEFDGAQDLDIFAFSSDEDLRRVAHSTPGRMQGRILAETGFVGKD